MIDHRDTIDLDRARALAALLDRDPGQLAPGALLPPMWHVAYFLPRPAQSALGRDGHPLVGFPSPPGPNLRRMFAGGRATFTPGLRLGARAAARTEVVEQRQKEGSAGTMTFMTTRMVVRSGDGPVLVDERDIVYLDGTKSPAPLSTEVAPSGPSTPPAAEAVRQVEVDPRLLFRFSALTYNAHRIHYDRDYARGVEGYPGLVVHGPLQALLMAEVAGTLLSTAPRVRFDYKLVAPLFEGQGMFVTADRTADAVLVQVVDASGRQTATGTLTIPA